MYVLCINLYACLLDNSSEPGTVSTPLIPTLGMQRQMDFFKSEANQLGLLSEFQDNQGCIERLLPQKKNNQSKPFNIQYLYLYFLWICLFYCLMGMNIAFLCVCVRACVSTEVRR